MSDASKPIQVLIVDDSPISRKLLIDLIQQTDDMQVIGEATNGVEAVRMNSALVPDIIAMDLSLPLMDGLQATEMIMRENPNRVVLCTDIHTNLNAEIATQAASLGALDVCAKPRNTADIEVAEVFIKTLRALSKVRVIRAWKSKTGELRAAEERFADYPGIRKRAEVVLIVSSTGGPQALEVIFRKLPGDFPLPIVIVQHIDNEFVENMTGWLDSMTPLMFKSATNGERPLPGHVYVAPGGYHLRIAFDGRFMIEPDLDGHHHIPSGDVLLESAAKVYGPNAIGVILTGMGQDGANGLLKMRQQGARTIVQDEATSIVFGMPKEAIDLGAAEYVEPLSAIADLLVSLVMKDLKQNG